MDIPIEPEFKNICKDIEAKNLQPHQWAEIESDDMFQSGNFLGGFDAEENEFCFSYFAPNKIEFWFQFNLETALEISKDKKLILTGRVAE
jgi:hypothetical protein